MYQIKAHEKPYQMQKKSSSVEEYSYVEAFELGYFPQILRISLEIIRRYRICDENMWGLKGYVPFFFFTSSSNYNLSFLCL